MAKAALSLRGRYGLIGFVPRDAIDPFTHQISIAVTVTFEASGRHSVSVGTSHLELQDKLQRVSWPGGVGELRRWLVERALRWIYESQPRLKHDQIRRAELFWVCRNPQRLEPFLR